MAALPFRRAKVAQHAVGGDESIGYTSQKTRTNLNFNPFRSGGPQYDSRRGNESRGMADASASASMTMRNTETHFEKNAKGGIKVEELEKVWKFMKRRTWDPQPVQPSETLTLNEFLFVMKSFTPNFSAMEARWILNLKNRNAITYEEFVAMVGDNQVDQSSFDPVRDAFAIVDVATDYDDTRPGPVGHVNLQFVSQIFQELRVGDASKEELQPFIDDIASKLIEQSQQKKDRRAVEEDKMARRIDLKCFRDLTDFRHKDDPE